MRKRIWIAAAVIVLAVAYVLLPGFMRQGDGFIADYALSEDGNSMTTRIGKTASAGYIRKVEAQPQQGDRLYLDCYAAFGGVNGSLGAMAEYTIPIEADVRMILLYRAPDCYEPVLEKDGDGQWRRVNEILE